ncbi:MAG: hypothetical protein MR051_05155 [Lentisphaeria bacterium]|nr:hypothetical protein [Lentisphaeria bacterium]
MSVAGEIADALHIPPPAIPEGPASALISMTRDKAVIHHHGRGYEKFASGDSLSDVRTELAVYELLGKKKPETFQFSQVDRVVSTAEHVNFFMLYAPGEHQDRHPELSSLTHVLREFFSLTPPKMASWRELWDGLDLPELLNTMPSAFRQGQTPVGLVHRDFKPWNVKNGGKPLLYDFESVSFAGCPLEDFFNYVVDPLLHRHSPAKVLGNIRRRYWQMAADFLTEMRLPAGEVRRYWCWYLAERIVFWRRHKQPEFAENFVKMLQWSLD